MDVQDVHGWLMQYLNEVPELFQRLPGSSIFLRYVKSSYQNDPVRSGIELFLCLFAVRYLLAPAYSTQKKSHVKLSEEEVDELVDEWTPEPLVASQTAFEEAENEKRPVIVGPTGPKSKLSNGRTVTNLASYNYYNFVANETLKEKAIQTLRTYGVGPCGPPGFYGTQDVHMKTEADIAAHLGAPACIVYAQAFSTISSVIPAFSKRGDIIVADRAVNYAVRKGLQISRSTVRWYDHNDLDDMQRVLERVVKEQAKKPLTRRFIVTEGLFEDVGDMIDLPKIIELKLRYKFRLILDETWSFGVLGRNGRGITEHQNVDAAEVDMIVGSLAGPLCAGGGFCAGSDEIVEHQRISAAAYTFSAALPAMLATTASETLSMLQTMPDILAQSRENVKTMWAQLDPRSDWVHCTSSPENPMMLLILKPDVVTQKKLTVADQEALLQDVVDEVRLASAILNSAPSFAIAFPMPVARAVPLCLANSVLITRLKSMPRAGSSKEAGAEDPQPALKVCVTTGLSKKEIERAGVTIRHAITKVVKARK
ncbi:serine palmitoyltransferase component [Ptychographa xylographoides]|nr:serine palmitoyltransferase component [Ptychographa xylographoides]